MTKDVNCWPPDQTCTVRPKNDESLLLAVVTVSLVPDANLPFFQEKSTVMPPRTRAPLIDPEAAHCEGSAGISVILRVVDRDGTSGT